MTTRAPLEPRYSRRSIPASSSVRERRIAQDAATRDATAIENVGAGNRIRGNDRPYQNTPIAARSRYLFASPPPSGPTAHHHRKLAKRSRRAR
jgi:hypothetical protein